MASKEEKVAIIVAEALAKDLHAPSALPYQILSPQSGGLPPQSFLRGFVSGNTRFWIKRGFHREKDISAFCYVYFNLAQPRPFELQAFIYNPGLVTYIHRLAYAVPLAKSVRGPVGLENPRQIVFSGPPEAATRLNGNSEILRLAKRLAVTERGDLDRSLKIDRYLHIYPGPSGSLLVLHTLPKMLIMRQTLLASDVLQLASAIEDIL